MAMGKSLIVQQETANSYTENFKVLNRRPRTDICKLKAMWEQ